MAMPAPHLPLARDFYARPTLEVARTLIGKTLWHHTDQGTTAGIIVETEAYIAPIDPAAHGYNGPTPRTRVMFGPPGYAYVYRSYGMHFCVNLVTEREGIAAAVLLRALQPTDGLRLMRERRGLTIADRDLARGPGRLCQALGITLAEDGMDVLGHVMWVAESPSCPLNLPIAATPRVGISRATDLPWRFALIGSPYVSHRLARAPVARAPER